MDETIDRLVISVRADTASFARDVSAMRGELEGPLAAGATRAGRTIENALGRAIEPTVFESVAPAGELEAKVNTPVPLLILAPLILFNPKP